MLLSFLGVPAGVNHEEDAYNKCVLSPRVLGITLWVATLVSVVCGFSNLAAVSRLAAQSHWAKEMRTVFCFGDVG